MTKAEYTAYLKLVGQNVRNCRVAQNMTMEALSYESDIEYRQIGRIERGEINTTIISLLKISIALNVEIVGFFKL